VAIDYWLFNGQRWDQPPDGGVNPISWSKISAHFATHTWQMIGPAFVSTTWTWRLWRPQSVHVTSLK
jgi:hypothetical protein